MEKLESMQYMVISLAAKANRNPYCFDKCIKKEEIGNELSRDQ